MQKLLSGGAGYLILALIASGLIGGVWLKYDGAIKRAEQLETALAAEQAVTASQRNTIASQARTSERRAESNTQQASTEDAINAEPDSQNCASSAPIIRGFSIMRERAAREAANDIE